MIKGYYVNLEGSVVTVLESDGKFYNPWGEVLVSENTVYEGGYDKEDAGFRVDEEYSLWTSLKLLAEVLEK